MRDIVLWRLCPKECAWIDCDTKHEWISNMKITKSQLKQIIKEELTNTLSEISAADAESILAPAEPQDNLPRDIRKKAFGSEGAEVLKKLRPEAVLSAARDSEEYKHTLKTGDDPTARYSRSAASQLGYVSHDPVLHMVINGMCKTMGKGDNCQPIYHHGDREYGFRINFGLFGPVDKRTDFGKMVDGLYDQISNELKPKSL